MTTKDEFTIYKGDINSIDEIRGIINQGYDVIWGKVDLKGKLGDMKDLLFMSGIKKINNPMGDALDISDNQLEILAGCPEVIIGNLVFSNNPIKSLSGFSKEIYGDIYYMNSIFPDVNLSKLLNNIPLICKIKGNVFINTNPMNTEENLNFKYREKYDAVYEYIDGIAMVQEKGKYGFINSSGEIIIPIIYDHAKNFSDGVSLVKLGKKYGYIDKTGATILPFKYSKAYSFYDGVGIVWQNKKYHYINKTGNLAFPDGYNQAYSFSDGLSRIILNRHYGFIDKLGNMAIQPLRYYQIFDFSEGYAVVENGFKYRFIDKTGKEINKNRYDNARSFSDGLSSVYRSGIGYQFIDKAGNAIKTFDDIDGLGSFYFGRACVVKEGKFGFLDKNFEVCIPIEYPVEYNGASEFHFGIAEVKDFQSGNKGFLYTDGYVKWL